MSTQNTRFVRDSTGCITHVVKRVGAAQREVYEVLRGLRDPHLPHVFTIEEAEGGWDVCCEYVRGASLEEQCGLEDAELLRVALDVVQALQCIHASRPSIVHRDVKPANIVRRDEGGYVLIDFDAARIYKQTSQRDTMLMGTEGYAAPEQFGYMQTDERSDIYALGATLFELKTGRPYRPGEECPGRLRSVIRKCTAFLPEKRYRDAAALQRALLLLKDPPGRRLLPAACLAAGMLLGAGAMLLAGRMGAPALEPTAPPPAVTPNPPPVETLVVTQAPSPVETLWVTPAALADEERVAVRYTAAPHAVYAEVEGDADCICGLDISQMKLIAPNDGIIALGEGEKAEVELALEVPLTYAEECGAKKHNRPRLEGVRVKRCTLGGRAEVSADGVVTLYEEGVYEIDAMAAFGGDYRGPISVTLIAARDTRAYTDCRCVFDIYSVEYIRPVYTLPPGGGPVEIDLKYRTPVIDSRMCKSDVHARLLFMPAGWLSAPEGSDVAVDADNILRTTTPGRYQLDIPMWFRMSEEDHFHFDIEIR